MEQDLPGLQEENILEGRKEARGEVGHWGVYDSDLDNFEISFGRLLPRGEKLKSFIETYLAGKRGRALGLELGGTGSRLFESFDQNFFAESRGVALGDSRTKQRKELDAKVHHGVIPGDLTSKYIKIEVDEWRDGRMLDLLIKRVVGGSIHIPHDPGFLLHETRDWYRRMGEHSLMFLETKGVHPYDLRKWRDVVNARSVNKIKVVYNGGCQLLIIKEKGAVDKLPF